MGTGTSKHTTTNPTFLSSLTEENYKPFGLYPQSGWDLKLVRKLIQSKKLAPFSRGIEISEEINKEDYKDYEECPICFLSYKYGLNRSVCCKQSLCSECYLQVKKSPSLTASCPFCNRTNYVIYYDGPKTTEEKEKESEEQQKVIEAKIRMRNDEVQRDIEREKQRKSIVNENPKSSTDADQNNNSGNDKVNLVHNELSNDKLLLKNYYSDVDSSELDVEEISFQKAIQLSLAALNLPTEEIAADNDNTQTIVPEDSQLNEDEELRLAIQLSLNLDNNNSVHNETTLN